MSKATKAGAVAVALGAALLGVDAAFPPRILAVMRGADGGCVIPDCRTLGGRGPWDDAAEVDCRFVGPYSADGGPRWRGCAVGRAEYAVGTACLPSACELPAGVDPLSDEASSQE